jgi:hypothetical protein
MAPSAGATQSEAQVRARLEPYLVTQFGGSQARTRTVLSVFDRLETKLRVPSPTLRAGLVALAGTLAEPALDAFLAGGPFSTIDFGPVAARTAVAQSLPDGSRRRIVVDPRFQHEHFGLLTTVLLQELLHHDAAGNGAEDAVVAAVAAMTHAQALYRHPELAGLGTELSRRLNTLVLAWTNSRQPGSPRSGVIAPKGRGLYPGSPVRRRDLWSLFGAKPSDASPAPPELAAIAGGVVARGVGVPRTPVYGQATARLLGRLDDRWLTQLDRVRVSLALGLVSMDEVVKVTKLSRRDAVQTLELAGVRAACR